MFTETRKPTVIADTELSQFIFDKKSQNLAPKTIEFYKDKLTRFKNWYLTEVGFLGSFEAVSSSDIRSFMEYLQNKGHTMGGIHAYYRCLKTFFNFIELEYEPENNWSNPIKKIKTPKVPVVAIEGIELEEVEKLISSCPDTVVGTRDRCIISLLASTGVRSSELLRMNIEDILMEDSSILIRESKAKRPRSVFFGATARKYLRKHLKNLHSDKGALFISTRETRLQQPGLRQILRRACDRVGIEEQSPHDFRRFFALESLKKGLDLVTLSRLMGHAGLHVLQRYLAQTKGDLSNKYISPLD